MVYLLCRDDRFVASLFECVYVVMGVVYKHARASADSHLFMLAFVIVIRLGFLDGYMLL